MSRDGFRLQTSFRMVLSSALLAAIAVCPSTQTQAASAAKPGHRVAAQVGDPRQMRFDPVAFSPSEPARVELPNGMIVYLLEDHELPLVSVSATVRTGAWLDPADKVGLAQLTGMTMRTGGTQRMSAAELDEELEHLAAQMAVTIGVESGVAMLDVLKKDLARGLRLFADALRVPAFEPARVELAKLQALEGIRRRQDHPQSIASREFAKLLYGPDHPFARESSVQSITRLTREDLVAFHGATFHPNGMIMAVTGDFEKDAMLAELRAIFGDWAPGQVPAILFPPVSGAGERAVRFVGKGTTQTHIRAGHLSIKEDDPDYPALLLLNDILGGGSFRSRLFQDVRSRRGLAYSVKSVLRAGARERGVWGMSTETKTGSTQEMLTRLVANMERLREQPVTDQELAEAKDAFVNSFVFSFSSPSAIVNRRVQLEYDGLPKDFIQRLRDRVVALTKEDLLRVARAHLHPDQLKILAVGPAETAASLGTFGEVKEILLAPEG